MSYSVTRRTREIGIRIALGAQLNAVQALIVRQGMRLTLIAVAIGLPAAFALAKFSTSLLYGVRPHDIITFTAVPIFLASRSPRRLLDPRPPSHHRRPPGRPPLRITAPKPFNGHQTLRFSHNHQKDRTSQVIDSRNG